MLPPGGFSTRTGRLSKVGLHGRVGGSDGGSCLVGHDQGLSSGSAIPELE